MQIQKHKEKPSKMKKVIEFLYPEEDSNFGNCNNFKCYRYIVTNKEIIFMKKVQRVKNLISIAPKINKNEHIIIISFPSIPSILSSLLCPHLLLICTGQ